MITSSTRFMVRNVFLSLIVGGALHSMAVAAPLSVSVPSSSTGTTLQVTGQGLAPGQTIKVLVTDPAGQKHVQSEVAKADGSLAVEVRPGVAGKYAVDVLDAADKRIGGGHFLHMR